MRRMGRTQSERKGMRGVGPAATAAVAEFARAVLHCALAACVLGVGVGVAGRWACGRAGGLFGAAM